VGSEIIGFIYKDTMTAEKLHPIRRDGYAFCKHYHKGDADWVFLDLEAEHFDWELLASKEICLRPKCKHAYARWRRAR
jgi:hypothetical protein